jgi:hypothetical protein
MLFTETFWPIITINSANYKVTTNLETNKQPGFLHKGIYFIQDNNIIVCVI